MTLDEQEKLLIAINTNVAVINSKLDTFTNGTFLNHLIEFKRTKESVEQVQSKVSKIIWTGGAFVILSSFIVALHALGFIK
jgi:hypothetical protein